MSILNRLHAELFSTLDQQPNQIPTSVDSNRLNQTRKPLKRLNTDQPGSYSELTQYKNFKNGCPPQMTPPLINTSTWGDYFNKSTTIMIETMTDWRTCFEKINNARVVALDTETTGLDPHQSRIRFIQIAIPAYVDEKESICADNFKAPRKGSYSEVFIVDLFKLNQTEIKKVVSDVVKLIENPGINTVFHHAVFDIKMFRSTYGKRFGCRVFDTMIASQLVSAGYFVPEDQLQEWCILNNYRCDRTGDKVTITDEYTNALVALKKDNQKYYKPYYYRYGLADVVLRHLGVVLDKTEQKAEWSGLVSEAMLQYAAKDVMVLIPLFEILSQLIKINELDQAAKIEFACIGATAEIEYVGMPFKIEKALEIQSHVEKELNVATQTLIDCVKETGFRPKPRKNRKAADDEIQVQSNMEILQFMKYQAIAEGLWSNEEADYIHIGSDFVELSTQKDTLQYLESRLLEGSVLKQFIQRLQIFRKVKKRMEFLDSYLSSINPETERLHTSLQQLNPKGVGRFSSFEPNMQQVGNDSDIRALFAAENRVLVDADYSAIEMRIMAQLSQDPKLIEAFKNEVDIHKFTAANIAGIPIEEVGKDQRQRSKAINFGLIYGMSHETLKRYSESSYGVVMTFEEARGSRDGFFRVYNHIASWQDEQYRKRYPEQFLSFHSHDYKRGLILNELPGIRTLAGRLRVWPIEEKINRWGNPYSCKVGAITELYNSPDQGSGADILKLAMGILYKELVKKGWDDVQIIMTIHDELLLECDLEKSEMVKALLAEVMEKAAAAFIRVIPVAVEAVVMENWAGK